MTTPTLELASDSVHVGDAVTGRVHADAGALAGPITVELVWRTRGRCEPEEKVVDATTLTCADASEAPFTLTVPAAGPMSYAGETFSVDWVVRLAGGPHIEKSLTILPALRPSEDI